MSMNGAEIITMPGIVDKEIQELQEWAAGYVKNQGVTVATMATEANINRSLLSQFINHGKYNQNLIDNLKALRGRIEPETTEADVQVNAGQSKKSQSPPPPQSQLMPKKYSHEFGIQQTEDFLSAVGICSKCYKDRTIGAIIGHAGSGKTTVLEEFAKGRPDVVLIRANITMTVKGLLLAIGEAIGLGIISGSKERMLGQIVAELKSNPQMIIVDEADMLVDRFSVVRLETLRAIWDQAQIALVICGMPKLAKFIVKGPGGDENLAQIYSRIQRGYKMKGVSKDELTKILDNFNMDEPAKKHLLTRGASLTHGGLRRLSRILQNALDMTEEGEQITLEIIQLACSLLVTPETLGLSF
ncbi:DNA transposition protein [Desulfocucumis palustris]|uniref:DNA transposition protein n=1 Tax=Desulfocucumis palustris TaxID=1898651 RepID=A0A2L2XDL2_9FIRM|nr:ATP-binding protein [Desulfocucumis palustris]GBF34114.1 DNA transposition protein [Desulfocucumis palustris]